MYTIEQAKQTAAVFLVAFVVGFLVLLATEQAHESKGERLLRMELSVTEHEQIDRDAAEAYDELNP